MASTTAALGVGGGVALFCDSALHAFGPLGRSYYVLATAMAMCLLGVPAAYWQIHAMAPGWRRRLGVIGTGVVLAGSTAWIAAFGLLFTDPDAAFTQRLTPAGSSLMALGMLLLGVAVLASRRLSWRPPVGGRLLPGPAGGPGAVFPRRQGSGSRPQRRPTRSLGSPVGLGRPVKHR